MCAKSSQRLSSLVQTRTHTQHNFDNNTTTATATTNTNIKRIIMNRNNCNNNNDPHHRCHYYVPLSLMIFSLMVNLCAAEAFIPRYPNAFFSVRGGESSVESKVTTTSTSNSNPVHIYKYHHENNYKLSSSSNNAVNGAADIFPAEEDDVSSSSQSIKQIRVTSKGRLSATRMPPPLNSNNNKSNNRNNNGENVKDYFSTLEDKPIPAEFIAETALPTDMGQFRLRAYRTASNGNEYTGREPSVIYAADKSPFGVEGQLRQDVPIRIHDQCLTSEVFRSRRCDCSQQLKMALKRVAEVGGAIIYLQQEGRGIGLANKVAAYALQDVGMDTVDANLHLGFPEDCRHYGAVPSILHDMKIGSIQLMTNNPRKVSMLQDLGVNVKNTLPMVVPTTNPYNHRYMVAKHDRMDHQNLKPLFMNDIKIKDDDEATTTVIGEDIFVTEGEEMAANAINLALSDENYEGVLAEDNGYCFGRKSVEDSIVAMKEGKMVVVVDDMNRENEGDLIMAADACTPEDMAFIVRYSSGVICIAMDGDRMDKLGLPPMLVNNEDPKGTAFTVTVDATKEHGISTGISSTDRAKTVNLLASADAKVTDFARPGHIFPLRARDGGVLERDGHTEAAVDLSHLAGRARSGILCEIVSEDSPTEMMRLPELKRFCKKHELMLTSIVDLAQYRKDTEQIGI